MKLPKDWNGVQKEAKFQGNQMRDQIKGPPVPRAQKWWSPSRAKRELKITDSTALAPGRAPAVLISVVQDREGENGRLPGKVPPAQPASGARPFTLGQRRRQVLTQRPQGEFPCSFHPNCFRAALRMLTSESRRALLRLPALGPPRSSPGVSLQEQPHAPQSWSDLQCRPHSLLAPRR